MAALEAMLALRHLAGPLVRIELVSRASDFCYRPLRTAEPFEDTLAPVYELSDLTAARAARHRLDSVEEVDAANGVVRLASGRSAEYDFLLVAIGARAQPGIPGALTFWSGGSKSAVRTVVDELEAGHIRSVVFALPGGVTWPLPLYELALQTAARLKQRGVRGCELTFATSERSPLDVFGKTTSAGIEGLMRARGIRLLTEAAPAAFAAGELSFGAGQEAIPADRVIALPRLQGPRLAGLPHDERGFIPTDEHARVEGAERVFAAGDVTTCPIKQGGIGAQQADAAADMIAKHAGAPVIPKPFRVVMRGVLLTGDTPRYMSATAGKEDHSVFAGHPFWWPPDKIAGRYLAPFLATKQPTAGRNPRLSVTATDAAERPRL